MIFAGYVKIVDHFQGNNSSDVYDGAKCVTLNLGCEVDPLYLIKTWLFGQIV